MSRVKAEVKGALSWAARLTTMTHTRRRGKDILSLKDWVRMFKPNWQEIATDAELGRTELRVLIWCSTVVGQDQRIRYTQKEIAGILRVRPSVINRAFQLLVSKGLLLQTGRQFALNSRLATDQPTLTELVVLRREEAKALRQIEDTYTEEHAR